MMNDTDTGSAIVVEYDLEAAPEKVWRALTDAQLIEQWLMPNDFKPVVGHPFTFRTKPIEGWDGVIQCKVIDIRDGERLSYSWVGGAGEQRLDSVVTWTLTPSPSGGTHLLLEHTGFTPNDRFAFEGLSKGWRGGVGAGLKRVVSELS